MKDEQLMRQRNFTRPTLPNRTPLALPPPKFVSSSPVKRLTWDEMQRRHAQGLCFSCNERFTAGHKCQGPQLLLLKSYVKPAKVVCEEVTDDTTVEDKAEEQIELEISLHAFTGWSMPRTMRGSRPELGITYSHSHNVHRY